MGVAAPAYYPADMVRVFPEDGNKYEIVHGERVAPGQVYGGTLTDARQEQVAGQYLEIVGPRGRGGAEQDQAAEEEALHGFSEAGLGGPILRSA